jgi:hypothetical protein
MEIQTGDWRKPGTSSPELAANVIPNTSPVPMFRRLAGAALKVAFETLLRRIPDLASNTLDLWRHNLGLSSCGASRFLKNSR